VIDHQKIIFEDWVNPKNFLDLPFSDLQQVLEIFKLLKQFFQNGGGNMARKAGVSQKISFQIFLHNY